MSGTSKYVPVKHKFYYIPCRREDNGLDIIKISINNFKHLFEDINKNYDESNVLGVIRDLDSYSIKIYKILSKYQPIVEQVLTTCRNTPGYYAYCKNSIVFVNFPSNYYKHNYTLNANGIVTVYAIHKFGIRPTINTCATISIIDHGEDIFRYNISDATIDNINNNCVFDFTFTMNSISK